MKNSLSPLFGDPWKSDETNLHQVALYMTSPMSGSHEIDVVRAFVDAINRHSLADLSSLMTIDHTFIDSLGRTVLGRETMLDGWKAYWAAFPDYEIRLENILADGRLIAAFGSASGTYNGRRGLAPENRVTMPAAWKAVIEDRKVKHWQVYADWTEGMKIIERETKI